MFEVGWVFPLLLLVLMGIVLLSLVLSENKARNSPYETIDEGIYDYVEYTAGGGKYGSSKTVIYFDDGRTRVVGGHHSILFRKGARVRVVKNKWNEKIEAAE